MPDPSAISAPTREQVSGTRFAGGEGTWFDSGIVYFTTKKDNKVHAYDTRSGRYELIYDEATTPGSPLSGLDGITVSRSGDLFLCEDGGRPRHLPDHPGAWVARFLTLTGSAHAESELAGVTFDPSGTRMYFSSMRGYGKGAIYEVSGPFRGNGTSGAPIVIDPRPEVPTTTRGAGRLRAPRRVSLSRLLRRGRHRTGRGRRARGRVAGRAHGRGARWRRSGATPSPQPRQLMLVRANRQLRAPGTHNVRLRLSRKARRKLQRARRAKRVMLTAQLTKQDGKTERRKPSAPIVRA